MENLKVSMKDLHRWRVGTMVEKDILQRLRSNIKHVKRTGARLQHSSHKLSTLQ